MTGILLESTVYNKFVTELVKAGSDPDKSADPSVIYHQLFDGNGNPEVTFVCRIVDGEDSTLHVVGYGSYKTDGEVEVKSKVNAPLPNRKRGDPIDLATYVFWYAEEFEVFESLFAMEASVQPKV